MGLHCLSLTEDEEGFLAGDTSKADRGTFLVETVNLGGFPGFWSPPVCSLVQVQSLMLQEDGGFAF